MEPCSRLFFYCRAGFEQETLAELLWLCDEMGVRVSGTAPARSGYVLLQLDDPRLTGSLLARLRLQSLTFSRHFLACDGPQEPLPIKDRLTPLGQRLASLSQEVGPFAALWLGYPDSEAGKVLAPLCRALQGRLEESLRKENRLQPDTHHPRAEIVLLSGTEALTGYSWPDKGAHWPMGIPRLRLANDAPSRAALKLEEAFWQLLSPEERRQRLTPGQRAVDLGAAPGGWSQVLLQRGLAVIAVDRADLAPTLRDAPRLHHRRADGFHFQPSQSVDWLFCDMVEKPRRIAALIQRWAQAGWCRAALFNLKLPMKKRFEELQLCRQLLLSPLQQAGIRCQLRFRHLYHDREEVTGLLLLDAHGRGKPGARQPGPDPKHPANPAQRQPGRKRET
ncbi:MAG: 23S rRNA (cytidine(2498)-2'-O)-methyltransferase RlmM [Magnetococcales bacterium]|nr:23S rRNA (cytidine(2498)-2'-O)-methyltransferase RlmM [Magnetococcales bacterium]